MTLESLAVQSSIVNQIKTSTSHTEAQCAWKIIMPKPSIFKQLEFVRLTVAGNRHHLSQHPRGQRQSSPWTDLRCFYYISEMPNFIPFLWPLSNIYWRPSYKLPLAPGACMTPPATLQKATLSFFKQLQCVCEGLSSSCQLLHTRHWSLLQGVTYTLKEMWEVSGQLLCCNYCIEKNATLWSEGFIT